MEGHTPLKRSSLMSDSHVFLNTKNSWDYGSVALRRSEQEVNVEGMRCYQNKIKPAKEVKDER